LLSLGIQVLGNAAKLIWAGFHCCCREVHLIIQSLDLLTPAYSKNVELSQLCTIFLYINYLHYQRCDSFSHDKYIIILHFRALMTPLFYTCLIPLPSNHDKLISKLGINHFAEIR
jgi:hypothetical protein